MAEVDPDDDEILRFAVCWYRYDPERHERRHCVVAAFDNEGEMLHRMDLEGQALRVRRGRGEAEEVEHIITGRVKRPGNKRKADVDRARRRPLSLGSDPWVNNRPIDLPPRCSDPAFEDTRPASRLEAKMSCRARASSR
jgi:hypothetical protein